MKKSVKIRLIRVSTSGFCLHYLIIFSLLFMFQWLSLQSQHLETINYTDNQGLKQGKWEKIYPNGNTAYRAFFVNDKPVGEFLRFHENGKQMVIINYDERGNHGQGTLFDENGQKIAEGNYISTNKDGQWFFFNSKGNLFSKEFFENNKRQGKAEFFYPNGNISIISFWKDDLKNGEEVHFYPNGATRLKINYKEGVMHGEYLLFSEDAAFEKDEIIEIKGNYFNGKMHGDWIFYLPNGDEDYTISYINGIPKDTSLLDKLQEERFREFELNRGKLKDPQDYADDPDGYMIEQ